MASVSAGTFHVVHTELVVGILSLAAMSLVLLCVLRLSPKIPFLNLEQKERLAKAFDNTQMVSSVFGLIFIPIAMVSGIIASEGEATTDPVLLNKNSESLFVLQNIRDEAHRIAVNENRRLRLKDLDINNLLSIKGVSEESINELVRKYKTLDSISSASLHDLETQITKREAIKVFNYFSS